jgi:hypothetical protein
VRYSNDDDTGIYDFICCRDCFVGCCVYAVIFHYEEKGQGGRPATQLFTLFLVFFSYNFCDNYLVQFAILLQPGLFRLKSPTSSMAVGGWRQAENC